MGFAEKRTSERIAVEQEIRVFRGDDETIGTTANLSLGGAQLRIALSPPPRLGERLGISFRVPLLDGPLQAQAEVRWRSEIDTSMIGIQFVTGFRARETWALSRHLEAMKARQDDP